MARRKYLDEDGLAYFWGKIKEWVNGLLSGKQDTLESGVNIKTVGGESILGDGDIPIEGGGGTLDYEGLDNKPSIGGVELVGDKSAGDLGLQSAIDSSNKLSYNLLKDTPTIPTVPTNVSAFINDAGYLTQHQPLTNYVQKSQTVGLLKNDGTVDTTQYGTYSKPSGGIPAADLDSGVTTSLGKADTAYQKPSGGIPASDLASGVIPTVPVQDVTVGGTSVVSSGTAAIQVITTTELNTLWEAVV